MNPKKQKFYFSHNSTKNMFGVHPNLIFFAFTLISRLKNTDITILNNGGKRNQPMQTELFEKGASKTLDSLHQYGLALDIVSYKNFTANWEKENYKEIHKIGNEIIKEYNLPIHAPFKWDLAHWEIKTTKNLYKKYKNILPFKV